MGAIIKKFISLCLVVITFLNLASCLKDSDNMQMSEELKSYSTNCSLIVNEKEISHNGLLFFNEKDDVFIIPLLTIVRALGGNAKWYNNRFVTITCNGEHFVLNPTKNKLTHLGSDFWSGNIFAVSGGVLKGFSSGIIGEEYVLNTYYDAWFFRLIGVTTNYDYDNATITIVSKNH